MKQTEELNGKSLKPYLGKLITPQKTCTICAKGALFLAHVGLFNKVKVKVDSYCLGSYSVEEPLLK